MQILKSQKQSSNLIIETYKINIINCLPLRLSGYTNLLTNYNKIFNRSKAFSIFDLITCPYKKLR